MRRRREEVSHISQRMRVALPTRLHHHTSLTHQRKKGTTMSENETKSEKKSDMRKQSLYLPTDVVTALQEEAKRLDRSLSWVVQRCIKSALPEVRELPSMTDIEGE